MADVTQLPELAEDLADSRLAVFIDAMMSGESVGVTRIEATEAGIIMTHAADPRGLMTICEAIYQQYPEVWLVTAVAPISASAADSRRSAGERTRSPLLR